MHKLLSTPSILIQSLNPKIDLFWLQSMSWCSLLTCEIYLAYNNYNDFFPLSASSWINKCKTQLIPIVLPLWFQFWFTDWLTPWKAKDRKEGFTVSGFKFSDSLFTMLPQLATMWPAAHDLQCTSCRQFPTKTGNYSAQTQFHSEGARSHCAVKIPSIHKGKFQLGLF